MKRAKKAATQRPKPIYFIIGGIGMPGVTFVKSLARDWHRITMPAVHRIYREVTGRPWLTRDRARGPQRNLHVWGIEEEPFDEARFAYYCTKFDAWEIAPDGSHRRVGPAARYDDTAPSGASKGGGP